MRHLLNPAAEPWALGYQDAATLVSMIATTTRPWGSDGIAAPAPPGPV